MSSTSPSSPAGTSEPAGRGGPAPSGANHSAWDRLESQITWYSTRARSNQLWFKVLKVGQIVVAAAIPVVAAAGATATVAGAMGAVVVILEGVQQLFQFQQNWTSYRTTTEALKHEKYLFLAGADPYSSPNRDQVLAQRVESLVSAETSAWRAQQQLAQPSAGRQGPSPS